MEEKEATRTYTKNNASKQRDKKRWQHKHSTKNSDTVLATSPSIAIPQRRTMSNRALSLDSAESPVESPPDHHHHRHHHHHHHHHRPSTSQSRQQYDGGGGGNDEGGGVGGVGGGGGGVGGRLLTGSGFISQPSHRDFDSLQRSYSRLTQKYEKRTRQLHELQLLLHEYKQLLPEDETAPTLKKIKSDKSGHSSRQEKEYKERDAESDPGNSSSTSTTSPLRKKTSTKKNRKRNRQDWHSEISMDYSSTEPQVLNQSYPQPTVSMESARNYSHNLRKTAPQGISSGSSTTSNASSQYHLLSQSAELARRAIPPYSPGSEYLELWNVDVPDKSGKTPLIHAVCTGDLERVKVLLDVRNANVNIKGGRPVPLSPLHWAFKNKAVEIAGELLRTSDIFINEDMDGNAPIHQCLIHSELRPLLRQIAFHKDVDINEKTERGNTALILAIDAMDHDAITLLLYRGADVHMKNPYPLHHACVKKSLFVVKALIDNGADLEARDPSGNTALHIASRLSAAGIVQYLLKLRADPSAQNARGQTAHAVASDSKVLKLLEDYNPGSKHWRHEIAAEDLEMDENATELGAGFAGTVVLGTLYGTPCAVKRLREKVQLSATQYEIGLMSEIRHPNIVLFLGTCHHRTYGTCILTEYIAGGSLRRYLAGQQSSFKWSTLLHIAIGTARAMAWLHSRIPPILHRDLHTNNILVTRTVPPTVKVSDFGISQIQGAKKVRSIIYERIRPPEIKANQPYTTKSDVFMYALVLHELLSKQRLVHVSEENLEALAEEWAVVQCELCQSMFNSEETFLSHRQDFHGISNPTVPSHSIQMSHTYIDIIRQCITPDPNERPSFRELIVQLETLMDPKWKAASPYDGVDLSSSVSDLLVMGKTMDSYYADDDGNDLDSFSFDC